MDWKKIKGFQKQQSSAVSPSSQVVLVLENIDSRMTLRITDIGTDVTNVGAWTNLVWNFNTNGVKSKDFPDQKDRLGSYDKPLKLATPIEVPPSSVFTVTLGNLDATNTWTGGVVIQGEYGRY